MKDNGWCGFIGTLKCLVGLHDWADRQWAVPRCARPNCYKFKKRKQPFVGPSELKGCEL